ncbi:HTH-type transcriptional regulator SinR [Lentibacillus sp. JNUCC-1]|uniref:helix-turn-helix domain-containing protein n=1 Tax=Lentibacillus sp. JNUCC-1 TaxID=2654513 RepID=UPI0012E8E9E1|nr:helix-turn-helix transcriptional regulator [Lentibacillus sp. JNUCC-1]MUV36912.1 HTH-type transcriptional regulator SinR [Lentibacillus sp. JNUCC-1]
MKKNNISLIRKQKGYTLSELAKRAGVSKSYLSTIERNINQNPSFHIIQKIAVALNVDVNTLFGNQRHNQLTLDQEWLRLMEQIKYSGLEEKRMKELKKVIQQAESKPQNDRGEITHESSNCKS